MTYDYKIVSEFCKKNKISYTKFHTSNGRLINNIKKISPDLIITCYFRKIISIIRNYPNQIKTGEDLKDVKGIGKGTIERIN